MAGRAHVPACMSLFNVHNAHISTSCHFHNCRQNLWLCTHVTGAHTLGWWIDVLSRTTCCAVLRGLVGHACAFRTAANLRRAGARAPHRTHALHAWACCCIAARRQHSIAFPHAACPDMVMMMLCFLSHTHVCSLVRVRVHVCALVRSLQTAVFVSRPTWPQWRIGCRQQHHQPHTAPAPPTAAARSLA